MTRVGAWQMAGAVLLLCAGAESASPAQTFKTFVEFDGTNGALPFSVSLVQGIDGNFYGTTSGGGANFPGANTAGVVFRIAPSGSLTTLYSFCAKSECTDGANPYAGLVLSSNGNFYGTTDGGGTSGQGTVFEVNETGGLSPLYSFDNTGDGIGPFAPLIQGINGNLYGTTSGGNIASGTVFEISAEGALTTIYNFCSQPGCTDGGNPNAGLIQGSDGEFYGSTPFGGSDRCRVVGCGTLFRITSEGKLTTLHRFDKADGNEPRGDLLQGFDGTLYGETISGGAYNHGTIFSLSPQGLFMTLYDFCAQSHCTDGASPNGGLVQGTDGNFYGTTQAGGARNLGTIFEITSEGTLTTLHSFDKADGAGPVGGLLQATNGIFYGTTELGGNAVCPEGCGTIFSLDTGLGPFVAFVRNPAKTGQVFGILGQGFTETISVSLNGIPASFTVVSDTFIRATVPVGATTGFVTVVTPSGTLTSNVPFHVIP